MCPRLSRATRPLAFLFLASAVACGGGNAVAPDDPVPVGGTWAGTITLENENVTSLFATGQPVSVTIVQADASATGEFRSPDVSGAFAAVITGSDLNGSLTLQGSDGCSAAAPMHGVAESSELRLNVATIGAGTCRWGGTSLRIRLRRS